MTDTPRTGSKVGARGGRGFPVCPASVPLVNILLAGILLAGSCRETDPLREIPVVATTTLVGDVVRIIGGEQTAVTVLLPVGVDPHSFEPSPRDVGMLSRARLVYLNGLGLEHFLNPLLGTAIDGGRTVEVSAGISPAPEESVDPDSETALPSSKVHGHPSDPHVWFVPPYVGTWAATIARTLAVADPGHAGDYQARAVSFIGELDVLDQWIRDRIETIPHHRRILVTDHATLGHFARHYGLVEAGAVLPGFSTLAEPSARDVAGLVERIRAMGAPAIFVGISSNAELARRVAADAGIPVVSLYTGSLSAPEGPAGDYVSFMRYNVNAIVAALRGTGA